MGYEVKYHYHDKTESGYDTDDAKTFAKRVGKSFEDTSLGAVASAIIRQLARRDIWVVNVEIVEFVKKEISFRESKGGIVIKNRKFNFDSVSEAIVEDDEVIEDEEVIEDDEVVAAEVVPVKKTIAKENLGKPLREEVFNPEIPGLVQECKRRGYIFTVGKSYNIYEEVSDNRGLMYGMNYTVLDDNGTKRNLNDKHFMSKNTLSGFENSAPDSRLSYGGNIDSDMPNLRG
jgi:hypothetical protein